MSQLWKSNDTKGSPGNSVRMIVKGVVKDINRQVASKGVVAINIIRNVQLQVLKGQRTGKRYRKPYTKRATYTASAPGEAPARRTGNLRLHWNGNVRTKPHNNSGILVVAELESQEEYSGMLDKGTKNMAARPFVDTITEKALPEVVKACNESYN